MKYQFSLGKLWIVYHWGYTGLTKKPEFCSTIKVWNFFFTKIFSEHPITGVHKNDNETTQLKFQKSHFNRVTILHKHILNCLSLGAHKKDNRKLKHNFIEQNYYERSFLHKNFLNSVSMRVHMNDDKTPKTNSYENFLITEARFYLKFFRILYQWG